jgi:hypothetical protein
MSIVSPFHDASSAGCLANASLNASAKTDATDQRVGARFTPCAMHAADAAPQPAPCRASWRRVARALFDLVSGPTMPHNGHA